MRALGSLVVILLLLPAGAAWASAISFEGDVHTTINVRDRYYWSSIYLSSTEELAYSVEVLEGPTVNVSLIDDSALEQATAGKAVDAYQKAEGTQQVSQKFRRSGMYALVIEKTAEGNCSCKVDITRTDLGVWQDSDVKCVCGGIIFVVMVAAVVILFRRRRRAARNAPPPPIPLGPLMPVTADSPQPPFYPQSALYSQPAYPQANAPAQGQPPGPPAAVAPPLAPRPDACKYCEMKLEPGQKVCPRCLGDQGP